MKRPAFQFYPGDWLKDLNLRRCSAAARGVWIDILCLMHDSDEYGVLRWPLKEIAQATGASIAHVKELADKGVLRGSDKQLTQPYVYVPRSGRRNGPPVTLIDSQEGPIWYSARMVRDEYVRTIRGDSSRFSAPIGDAPTESPKGAPKPPFGDGSSSSSSTSVIKTDPLPPKPRRKNPEVPWPSDFSLTDELRAYAEQHLPSVDALGLFEQFHNQALAKAWKYADWARAWQTYVRNCAPNSGHWAAGQYPKRSTGEPMMFGGEVVKWQ